MSQNTAGWGVVAGAPEQLERRVLLSAQSVLFTADFEGGVLGNWASRDIEGQGTISVVGSPAAPVRAGTRAAQFTLPAGSKRSELALPADPRGSERWYAFSVFIPQDWVADPVRDIVAQWHELPDFHLGEDWRVPPLSLALMNDKWQVASRWDSRPVNTKDESWNPVAPHGGRKEYYFPFRKGAWTDMVFHVKWSYQSDGLLELWHNGAKVITQAGPNTYNDERGNYFKLGIYKPSYNLVTNPVMPVKVLYHDEVRVADATATYADVAPGVVAPPPPIDTTLTISGTTGADTIRVTQSGPTLTVTRNGVVSTLGTAGKNKLVINGLEGDDTILLSPSVTINASLNGGAGRDRLRGGAGRDEFLGGAGIDTADYSDSVVPVSVSIDDAANDGPAGQGENVFADVENVFGGAAADTLAGNAGSNLLLGNAGDDTVRGGGGRDVLIGGAGADRLSGEADEDLLIASRLTYDNSFPYLQTLRYEWQYAGRTYADRIARLRAGVLGVRITATTAPNDSAVDTLAGGTGRDWFVAHAGDLVSDKATDETDTRF